MLGTCATARYRAARAARDSAIKDSSIRRSTAALCSSRWRLRWGGDVERVSRSCGTQTRVDRRTITGGIYSRIHKERTTRVGLGVFESLLCYLKTLHCALPALIGGLCAALCARVLDDGRLLCRGGEEIVAEATLRTLDSGLARLLVSPSDGGLLINTLVIGGKIDKEWALR